MCNCGPIHFKAFSLDPIQNATESHNRIFTKVVCTEGRDGTAATGVGYLTSVDHACCLYVNTWKDTSIKWENNHMIKTTSS